MKNFLFAATFFTLSIPLSFGAAKKPKLILVISIDQFRTDYLQKLQGHFLPAKGKKIGGFNYLMQKGAYFSHAQYGLLQNMTCPGHATILTGAYSYQMGIPNNDWYNTETGEYVYCAEDRTEKTVGATPSNPHVGTSPRNLKATTFGDELKNAYEDSKVIAIALKDRSSIMLGGHRADLSLWFDQENFQWVSSTFYLKDGALPSWIAEINKGLKEKVGTELVWSKELNKTVNPNALVPESKYTKDMGIAFDHKTKTGNVSSLLFPIGITMPVEVAEKAVTNYKLGQGKGTDVLAVSFSSHDYVGHTFGPESDEIRETTVLEDRAFSRLFNFIDDKVGLENTWIVLTADHGVTGNPKVLASKKIPAGTIDQEPVVKEIETYMNKKYGKASSGWTLAPSELNFYFNRKTLAEKELDLAAIRAEVVEHLVRQPKLLKGIAHVFSGTDVRKGTLPPAQFETQIRRTYFEGRSGDIIMIQEPNHIVAYGATTHMSGYSYDRYVPVIFAGAPFKAGLYAGGEVIDIAPTLSFLMGIIPPTSSEGRVLKEALQNVQ